MFSDFLQKMKRNFESVTVIKPKASRPKSAEIYLLAKGLKEQDA